MLPMCFLGIAFAFLLKSMHDLTFLSVLNTSIFTLLIKQICFQLDLLYFIKKKLEKLSILKVSQIFSPPRSQFVHYTEVKIYLSLNCWHYILFLQDDKLAWLTNPYICFPVTLHGKDIVTYAQSTAHKRKHYFWEIILQV
jgi:hypothetical protein